MEEDLQTKTRVSDKQRNRYVFCNKTRSLPISRDILVRRAQAHQVISRASSSQHRYIARLMSDVWRRSLRHNSTERGMIENYPPNI